MKTKTSTSNQRLSQKNAFTGLGKITIAFSLLFFLSGCEFISDFIKDGRTTKNDFPDVFSPFELRQ